MKGNRKLDVQKLDNRLDDVIKEKYYLMTNVISAENYRRFLPETFDYNNHHQVYTFINEGILYAVKGKLHQKLSDFIRSILALTDMLR